MFKISRILIFLINNDLGVNNALKNLVELQEKFIFRIIFLSE